MYGSNRYGTVQYGSNLTSQVSVADEINSEVICVGTLTEISSEITGGRNGVNEINSEITGGRNGVNEINSEITGGRNGVNEINSEITGGRNGVNEINSEITGKRYIPISRIYRILVKDGSGNLLGEFDNFKDLTFGKRLNNYGTASFKVPVTDTKMSLVSLRINTVWIYRQEDATKTLVWSGEQAMLSSDLDDAKNNWCTIYCFDWLEQLNSRFTRSVIRYTATDAGDLAWDLINKSQLDFQDTNTGVKLPGTAANDAAIGNVAWSQVNNIKVDDANLAYVEPESNLPVTNYLKASNFGFSIPSTAIILGVKVTIKAEAEGVSATNYIYSSTVKLIKAGTIQTTNMGTEDRWADVTDAAIDQLIDYGGENELWGETALTPSNVNNAGFGVAISATGVMNTTTTIPSAIFYVKMTVYYYAASGGSNGSFGITKGTVGVTMDRDRTYYNQNIMEAIVNLSDVLSGFDFEITNNKVFNVYSVKGVDLTGDIILEYGKNIKSCKITQDFVHPSNRAIILGEATGEAALQRVERNNATLQTTYKIREVLSSEMDVSEIGTLQEKGDAVLRKYQEPLLKVDMNMASLLSPNVTEFELGDGITLVINSGIFHINGQYRIFEWTIIFDNNNVETLSLILGNFTYE